MKGLFRGFIAATLLATAGITVQRSSHREALAILNEPCADNTDTFAWVSPGPHDKLYLIMDFNPLHEPGQGNQGLRACNGYRYEFHIAKGASLKERLVYRVEFTNQLRPEAGTDDRAHHRRRWCGRGRDRGRQHGRDSGRARSGRAAEDRHGPARNGDRRRTVP